MTQQEHTADPGYAAVMDQKDAAIAELRAYGVPMERAVVIVQSMYSAGRDRGLYLALRPAGTPILAR